jgi:hypothetical protein
VIGEIDGNEHPMIKGDDGVWTATIGPLAPDVYNYQFRADGVVTMDPQNPSVKLGFGAFPPASLVEIPGNGPVFDDAKLVPHGSVRIETYDSKSIGAPRTMWVYMSPFQKRASGKPTPATGRIVAHSLIDAIGHRLHADRQHLTPPPTVSTLLPPPGSDWFDVQRNVHTRRHAI